MTVITRFAPSPTGFLHIGGARTALFNWLFSKNQGGQFLLRIEDTDRARSTEAAVQAIYQGLQWLGLDWDGEPISQFARAGRHAEVAEILLAQGQAYHCYCTPEELTAMREQAKAEGRQPRYDGRWRDRDPATAPLGVRPTVRLKAPEHGETVVEDQVQGTVCVANQQLDDMILLRADGTPTYMLAVVVDDHDMGVTHVIRGDDHFTNTFRQRQIYDALGWTAPVFAHVPLLHGPDGAKLSKRHGALGIEAYRDLGMLPEALRNYLLRLGWSHGDDEIISTEQAIHWFSLSGIGRAPARFDLQKLTAVNAHYLRTCSAERLTQLVLPSLKARLGERLIAAPEARLQPAMAGLQERAKTLIDLAEAATFYVTERPLTLSEKAAALIDEAAAARLREVVQILQNSQDLTAWQEDTIEASVKSYAEEQGLKLGQIAQPLRAALSGSHVSPGIFQVMAILGREETIARITDTLEPA